MTEVMSKGWSSLERMGFRWQPDLLQQKNVMPTGGIKEAYLKAVKDEIAIVKSPVGMPGRAIHSHFLEKVKAGMKQPKVCPFNCIKTCDISRSPYCIVTALYNAFKGNFENGYAFAGSNAWRTTRIMSVKETISELINEWKRSDQPTLSSR